MTTPDPNNHRNPAAETNRFTGLYPDNTYPLVDGQLDIEQQKRLQARQESNRTPRGVLAADLEDVYRTSSNDRDTDGETYPAHPAFAETGYEDENDTPAEQDAEAAATWAEVQTREARP